MKRFLILAAAIALVPLAAPGSASAGGGCHGDYVPDAKSAEVTFSQLCMDPMVTRIPVKGTVRWTNKDQLAHNLIGAAWQWASDGDLRSGASIAFRFDNDGTFPYACTIHPGMLGAVVVGSGVTPADANRHSSSVTRVALTAPRTKATVSADPAAEPAAAPSSAAVVAAPASPPPPSAKAEAVATTPVASRSTDSSGRVLAGFAVVGALILAGIVLLARRTPPRQRELIG